MEYIGKMEVWTPKQVAFLMEHDFEGFPICGGGGDGGWIDDSFIHDDPI